VGGYGIIFSLIFKYYEALVRSFVGGGGGGGGGSS